MKIVTDSGADLIFSSDRRKEIEVDIVPLTVNLDGKSYQEGVDIEFDAFYDLLENSSGLPKHQRPLRVNLQKHTAVWQKPIRIFSLSIFLQG